MRTLEEILKVKMQRRNALYIADLTSTDIIEMMEEAQQQVKNLNIPAVSKCGGIERRELLFAFIKEVKEEFGDYNWDYLDFIAERVLQTIVANVLWLCVRFFALSECSNLAQCLKAKTDAKPLL